MVRGLVAVDMATACVVRVQRRSTQRSAAARNAKDAYTKTAITRAVAWLVSGTSKFLFPASIAGISSGRLAIHDIRCSRGGVVVQRSLIVFPSWKAEEPCSRARPLNDSSTSPSLVSRQFPNLAVPPAATVSGMEHALNRFIGSLLRATVDIPFICS